MSKMRKLSASPMTTFLFKREIDKVGLISVNIITHIVQGSRTGPADLATARPTFTV